MMTQDIYIKQISINNFRSFHDFEAAEFSQVNLITGKNNSGKTSLLEALFLCLGPTNPSLWANITARRGIRRVSPIQSAIPYLFHNLEYGQKISFAVTTSSDLQYDLEIEYIEEPFFETTFPTTFEEKDGLSGSSSISIEEETGTEVVVHQTYTPNKGDKREADTVISERGISIRNKTFLFNTSIFLSQGVTHNEQFNPDRYSSLDRLGRIPDFERCLRTIEPSLERTSLAIENDQAMVFGDVGYGLVPLSILGSGMSSLTNILLAIAYAKNAVVLIDEVENGLHYSKLQDVWAAIAEFAEHFNCQVFATTHSNECVVAAHQVFKKRTNYDFSLHRLVRKEGKPKLFSFKKEQIEAALTTNWELR